MVRSHYRPPGNINHYKGLVAQGFQPLKVELLWGKHRGSSEVAIRPILGARIWGSLAAPGRARGLGPTFAQRDTTTVFRPLKIFGRVLKTSNQPVRFSNVRFTSNTDILGHPGRGLHPSDFIIDTPRVGHPLHGTTNQQLGRLAQDFPKQSCMKEWQSAYLVWRPRMAIKKEEARRAIVSASVARLASVQNGKA